MFQASVQGYAGLWDQCGGAVNGQNWAGPTVCQPNLNLTCYIRDQYYSQCAQYNPLSILSKINNFNYLNNIKYKKLFQRHHAHKHWFQVVQASIAQTVYQARVKIGET